MADIRDAYDRPYRLRERYKREAPTLSPTQKSALQKVFEEDVFIEGMCKMRGIGAHVETGLTVLRQTDNSPFEVNAASSAAAVFADRCVYLTDTDGECQRIDHLERLTVAEERIARAIAKAKPK
jgi:hypothetical protein